ncbi:MAG: hypothetical protein QF886_24965, partial [Planctomycetota bacterium]|nr:hypothetical protein [Planctomycetota bacterium]
MDMLLRDIEMHNLTEIYDKTREFSPAPYLTDRKTIRRARNQAKKNGVWEDLTRNLDPSHDIPVIKRSAFRNYQRIGDRIVPQDSEAYRSGELQRAALALWLNHPNADVDYLQDLLWAYCDNFTWVMAAHEGNSIDLGSAALGATFAEILYLLGAKIEDEVKERVSA